METIAMKVYAETANLYKELKEGSDAKTQDQFLTLLLENYQNPRKVEVSKATDQDEIKKLRTENITLQSELDQKLESLKNMAERVSQLESENPLIIKFQVSEEERKYINSIIEMYSGKYDLTADQVLYLLIRDRKITR